MNRSCWPIGASTPCRVIVGCCLAALLTLSLGLGRAGADEASKPAAPGAAAAHAADTHGSGHAADSDKPTLLQFDAGSAIVNIAIFIGVFFILSKLVWPVILGALEARDSKIRTDLESAHQANLDAKSMLSQYEAKLQDASGQVQAMLTEAKKASELERQRIVAEARSECDAQRVRTLTEIEQAKKVAMSELATKTSDMALSVARRIVGRELKADDHAELIRQSLERLPSKN